MDKLGVNEGQLPTKLGVNEGQLPTNVQIKSALDTAQQALEHEKEKLGEEGKKIVQDLQEMTEAAKFFLDEKNPNESLQKIYSLAFEFKSTSPDVKVPGLPEDNELRLAKETLNNLKFVGLLLLNSGAFRRLLLRIFELSSVILREQMEEVHTSLNQEDKSFKEIMKGKTQDVKEKIEKREWPLQEFEKEELQQNLSEILAQLSAHPHFQKATQSLFALIEALNYRMERTKEGLQATHQGLKQNPKVQAVIDECYNLVVGFLGQDLVDYILHELQIFYDQILKDKEDRQWLGEVKNFAKRIIENPQVLDTENYYERTVVLANEGQQIGKKFQNRQVIKNINGALQKAVYRLNNDMARIRFAESTNKLARDLFYDERGNLSLNTQAINQIKEVLVPAVLSQLNAFPIPKIESHDKGEYEFIIENLVINVSETIPEKVKISSHIKMMVKTKKLVIKGVQNTIKIKIKDIVLRLRNVRVWFRKKSFPKIQDDLTFDLDISGDSRLVLLMRIGKATEEATDLFKTTEVSSHIDNLHINFISGKHDVILNIFKTLFSSVLKKRIQQEIDRQILKKMSSVDQTLNHLAQQMPQYQSKLYENLDQVRQMAIQSIKLPFQPKETKTERPDPLVTGSTA